ncbi:hypothetical protein [Spirochaeta cellobiosiphila]|uniref:hypothetical protein n=1 Tax=Spirochaeta cellobiosiphila TaxID=504483 RepID=UPI0004265B61|nr:hypothetical protein [Spirochaeta cellobiosiphila]
MVNKKGFYLLLTWLLIFNVVSVYSLEVSQGSLSLNINERNGSVIIKNTQTDESFFFADDPRTSFFSLRENDKSYVLGKGNAFDINVSKTASGVKVAYQNPFYLIIVDYIFIVSKNTMTANGLEIDVNIKNISERSAKVGLLFLIDTYLGEKGDHFNLSAGQTIKNERVFTNDMPPFWISRGNKNPGLMVMTNAISGVTQPSRLVFANWKRLEENLWSFEADPSRDFNLPPYSFNDSAVAQIYEDKIMTPQEERKIKILLGIQNNEGFNLNQGASLSPVSEILTDSSSDIENPTRDKTIQMKNDYTAVIELLDNINTRLRTPETLTQEELTVLQEVLKELERRQDAYLQQ